MASEAQRRAIANYDQTHKQDFRRVQLRLHREYDAAIIEKLEHVENMQGYIKALILEDIQKEVERGN